MADSTCSTPECVDTVYAVTLCRLHYRRSRPRTPDKPKRTQCVVCATEILRFGGGYKPKHGAVCSELCRRWLRLGTSWSCTLPSDHWARIYGATCEWVAPAPKVDPLFRCGTCNDCGAQFLERAWGVASKWCSDRCAKRVGKRARKAREHHAPGSFRYSDIMRQYRRQGLVCAYCLTPCDGLPDPEHVVPLSRGGTNDMSNLVAACRPCNGDKRDLTPTEWAADRTRRGLPELANAYLIGEPYRHLSVALAA